MSSIRSTAPLSVATTLVLCLLAVGLVACGTTTTVTPDTYANPERAPFDNFEITLNNGDTYKVPFYIVSEGNIYMAGTFQTVSLSDVTQITHKVRNRWVYVY